VTTENDLKKAIMDYLAARRVFHWRNNTGAMFGTYKGKKRFFRFGHRGSGDIFILHRGKFFSVELKSPGKYPTEDQQAWALRVTENGGASPRFDNIDDFISWWEAITV